VTHGSVERREKDVVSGAQNDEMTARSKSGKRVLELQSVTFDVFQNIDIDNRVKMRGGRQRIHHTLDELAAWR
jgi:hypothetical protein